MVAADGTVITAVVKEKDEAQREHQEAIRQGHMTGLVEHVTDDSKRTSCLSLYATLISSIVFSISLGALPARQMVTTKITVRWIFRMLISCAD